VVGLLPPPGSSAAGRAILWDGTAAIFLDSLGGNVDSGYAINDSDEIVGSSSYTGLLDDRHGVTWSGTSITALPSSLAFSPLSINNSGSIVGAGLVPGAADTFAALWNGTTLVNLGTPSGSASSYAAAINNAGAVVGSSTLMTYAGPVGQRATLWQGASIYDLNSLAEPALPPNYVLTSANLLNDNGWIIATGSDGVLGDPSLAFLMVPLKIVVSTNTLAFGNQAIGSASAAQTITVTNQGNTVFAVGALTTTADFTQANNCGTSLAPTASCAIQITFRPSTPGTNVGTVTLGSGQATYPISLNGIGTFDVTLTAGATGTAGAPLAFAWSSTPGAVCTPSGGNSGDGWSGSLGASGTIIVTESSAGTYVYGLTCALDGVSNLSPQLTVMMTMPSVTLSATPSSVTLGQAVSLTWNSTNAASCIASGGESGDGWAGSRPVRGTLSVTTPSAGTITYSIVCSNPPQSAQALAQVIATGSSSKNGGGSLGTLSIFALVVLCGGRLSRNCQRKNPGY
jgi:probable HAF family extracellular repeat protein